MRLFHPLSSIFHPRLAAIAAAMAALVPSAQAYEFQDSILLDRDGAFMSGPGWFSAGPAWLMKSMPGANFCARPYMIVQSGDTEESPAQNAYVGTLANPFNVMLFNNVSGFVMTSSPKSSGRLNPDATLASATWSTTPTDGNWSNGANWSPAAAPGSTSTTTNTDTATFNNSSITAITVDANRNLKFITFDLAASAYTFSGGPFRLSATSVISLASTFSGGTNTVETFNTNIQLLGNGSFTNSSTIAGTSLSFAGAVTQDATVTTAATLTINGVGNGQISGIISNGAGAGASLAVSKGGTGTWSLTNANNSYTGITTDGAGGTLSVQFLANGGANSSIGASSNAATNLVINASTFQYLGSGNSTDRLFTLGSGTSTLDSSGAGAVNFTNSGSIAFSATSARTLILSGSNTGSNTLAPTLGNPSAGALSVTKNGGGTWILTANNAFSGATTINGGTLTAAGTSGNQALGGTSGVTVNTGGTLLLGASNQIKDTATVNLGAGATAGTGGIFNTGGFNEGPAGGASGSTAAMGALTLNSNSTIDFTSGTSSNLLFASLTYTAGTAVTIAHWTGTLGTDLGLATNDRLLFISSTGLTDAQLASIQFTNDAGVNLGSGATQISFNGYFEIVPLTAVPEPSTWIGAALALAAIGFTQRKRLSKKLKG